MIELNYIFKTKTNLHTGSDQNTGILKTLRRQKGWLSTPIEYESNYNNSQRLEKLAELLYYLYSAIPKDRKTMRVWDEFKHSILRGCATNSKITFYNDFCKYWGIDSINNEESNVKVLELLDSFNDVEILETLRNSTSYLILKVRQIKANNGELQQTGLFNVESKPPKFEKKYEMIPCFSGNSIKGKLRRLVMVDYLTRIGMMPTDIETLIGEDEKQEGTIFLESLQKISKSNYHIMMTGGVLSESSIYEDIDKREQLINLCPAIGVFGSAIGNMTIEGRIAIGFAYPLCRERNTSKNSYWEYLDIIFGTRKDESKTEKRIEIIGNKESTTQMKYEYEVFAPGTPFEHFIQFQDSVSPILTSCFWHAMKLFIDNPHIGAMWSTGSSQIDLSELEKLIPQNSDKLYIDYIEKNKELMYKFWCISDKGNKQ